MKYIYRFVYPTAALLALAILSCGGDDSLVAGGGIGGTGVHSVGEATAIGSIQVNGVEYDTRQAYVFPRFLHRQR